MLKTRVLVAAPLADELVKAIRSVEPAHYHIAHVPELYPSRWDPARPGWTGGADWTSKQRERWLDALRTAHVLFDLSWIEAPETLARDAPELHWIQATVSGVAQVLPQFTLPADVVITTAAGVHATPLAEWVTLSLLYLWKRVWGVRDKQTARTWSDDAMPEARGRRVLIIGMGQVGSAIAVMARAIGAEVWAVRRSGSSTGPAERLVPRASLLDAVADVDAVVLACPLTRETYHLVDAILLARMRPSAIVVNVARGAVIHEAALVEALTSGGIAAAALDVFEVEPLPPDSPLWTLPNVLITPHNAGVSERETARIVELFCDNLRRHAGHLPLRNVYRPDLGY